jgi:hypothetical protein
LSSSRARQRAFLFYRRVSNVWEPPTEKSDSPPPKNRGLPYSASSVGFGFNRLSKPTFGNGETLPRRAQIGAPGFAEFDEFSTSILLE